MSIQEQIEYHRTRAMNELDRGYTAACTSAARAHLQLSSLHLAKLRDLEGGTTSLKPPLILG